MKTIKFFVLFLVATIKSCSNDDGQKNQLPVLENKTINVSESLTSDLITSMAATDTEGDTLTYSIVSQTPVNSVIINETIGELYVGNASAFDYEQNTSITVVLEVTDGTLTAQATLTINILDIQENG
ncbi:MAG: cadherin repeat domain-containing protein [Flavobacteriaceae bacterium]|nr:cadherin repeat domain-containing protein [Flavobacteriaceae bacterium]